MAISAAQWPIQLFATQEAARDAIRRELPLEFMGNMIRQNSRPSPGTHMSADRKSIDGAIHWIIPGVLACGERPGFPNHTVSARTVDGWLEEAQRQGVRSVINMLSNEEMAV